jgi:Secretion system C-terminal sorting domain
VSCPLCPLAGAPNPFPGAALQQMAYVAKPDTLTFKWKGEVLSGDTSLAGVYLSLAGVPVGDALFYVMPGTTQTTWLTQKVPFTYYSASTPDSAMVGVLSDAWVLKLLVTGSATGSSTLGTHLDVDDIVMSGGTVGFDMLETTNSLIMAYPNPANTIINFNLLGTEASMMEIVDVSGKMIYSENNILLKHVLNIENYSNGSYIVKFFNDKKEYIGSTRFNVAK